MKCQPEPMPFFVTCKEIIDCKEGQWNEADKVLVLHEMFAKEQNPKGVTQTFVYLGSLP